jgi:hypothetical protein
MPSTISTYIIFPSTEEFFDFFLQCVYSFHHKGLSFPLVSLFLGILFFWNYCKWNCFPIFFHSLFIFGVQKSYWFFFPPTLLRVFMTRSFRGVVSGSFRYKIMSSANRDSLTSSFPICIPFISSPCLIV